MTAGEYYVMIDQGQDILNYIDMKKRYNERTNEGEFKVTEMYILYIENFVDKMLKVLKKLDCNIQKEKDHNGVVINPQSGINISVSTAEEYLEMLTQIQNLIKSLKVE